MEYEEESPPRPSTSKQAAMDYKEKYPPRPSTSKQAAMEYEEESPPRPSTSKQAARLMYEDTHYTSTILPPTLKDEEEEILRLEEGACSSKNLSDEKTDQKSDDDERIAKIKFHCTVCDMTEMVHYFGENPPFACGVKFVEDTYVMRDPFQPPPPRWKAKPEYFIAMGANCSQCQATVCRDCGFFYTRTFCLSCGEKKIKEFPVEIQSRIRKQIATKEDS